MKTSRPSMVLARVRTLAQRLAITPGAVSQHLSILLANGLVTRTRVGGTVLYHRTPRGDTLAANTVRGPTMTRRWD